MVARRAVWFVCDGDGCERQYPCDLSFVTALSAWLAANGRGWRKRGGRHYCDECVADLSEAKSKPKRRSGAKEAPRG